MERISRTLAQLLPPRRPTSELANNASEASTFAMGSEELDPKQLLEVTLHESRRKIPQSIAPRAYPDLKDKYTCPITLGDLDPKQDDVLWLPMTKQPQEGNWYSSIDNKVMQPFTEKCLIQSFSQKAENPLTREKIDDNTKMLRTARGKWERPETFRYSMIPAQQRDLRGVRLDRSQVEQIVASARETGEIPNLRGVNLARANLNRLDLNGADLTEANLSAADLKGAILAGANLTGASLIWADMNWAQVKEAKLLNANLSEADLTGTDLMGADLTAADLTGADLGGANLIGADLTGADLTAADLTLAYWHKSEIKKAPNWREAYYGLWRLYMII